MGLARDVFKEVVLSTLPVIAAVLILQLALLDNTQEETLLFLACVALVLVGFTVFLIGVRLGINPVGTAIGSEIPKRKSRLFMIAVVFAISFLVTIAEPDVTVFGQQVHSIFAGIDSGSLVYSIAGGVAVFLIVAAFKIVCDVPLKAILTVSYAAVIALALAVYALDKTAFLGIAFDSGGVTTGPMTVPILLSLGVGICSAGAARSELDGFGMIGLASVGPIIVLLIVGLLTGGGPAAAAAAAPAAGISVGLMVDELVGSAYGVAVALLPLVVFFAFFQRVFLRYSWNAVKNMLAGISFAGIGVVVFLTGVYAGFMPVARELGAVLNGFDPVWVVLLGFGLGFIVAIAEPAVGILCDQVRDSSRGAISRTTILFTISFGVAVFVAVGMAKLVFDVSLICIVVPGYVLALALMWLSDRDMVGIAFDAGGVSTGPMSVALLMSMYIGMSSSMYGGLDATVNGFGLVALIALAPPVSLCLLGAVTKYRREHGGAL